MRVTIFNGRLVSRIHERLYRNRTLLLKSEKLVRERPSSVVPHEVAIVSKIDSGL